MSAGTPILVRSCSSLSASLNSLSLTLIVPSAFLITAYADCSDPVSSGTAIAAAAASPATAAPVNRRRPVRRRRSARAVISAFSSISICSSKLILVFLP